MLSVISSKKNLRDRRVLVRVDWNVPLKKGRVVDDYKIVRSLATIRYLQNEGAKVILLSHLGRPTKPTPSLSLKPIVKYVEKILNTKIALLPFYRREDFAPTQAKVLSMKRHEVVMLENLRFHPDEEKNSGRLAAALSQLGELFVLDGFAVAHRSAASVTGIAKLLPSYAGLLLSEEVTVLFRAMKQPKKPLVVLLGGAKADTKIPVLRHLLTKADHVLLGGGLFNTYLWATGRKVGRSLVAKEAKATLLDVGTSRKIVWPVDVVVGDAKGKTASVQSVQDLQVSVKQAIYDIGPESVKLFASYIEKANTIIWNGALGMFEVPKYSHGTKALAVLLAARSKGKAVGVAGGGETVELLQQLRLLKDVDLVSTGGGAMLEFLSGKELPGLKALRY